MHPFLNLNELSENQLYDKIHELTNRAQIVRSTSSNAQVISQIEMTLESVYAELENRASSKMIDALDATPVWDMDEALGDSRNRIKDAESEDKNNKKRRWRPGQRQRRNRGTE
ncbi:hypothetical protein NVP2275O_054 [Vibrio phage 2.275.O._10N.286.54.E11]|nr:hypothetical protein NVP2275O_054 [Vibrio phage 2.275.O._10N.286.54.E11]